MIGLDEAPHLAQHRRLVLDQAIGRQAAFAHPEAHRPATCVEAHADLFRRRDLVVEADAVRIEVEMVHRGGAAGQHQLRHRGFGRDRDHLRRQAGPDRKQRGKPVEQLAVLRRRHHPGEALKHVVMGIDEAGNDDVTGQIDDLVGLRRQACRRPHSRNAAPLDIEAAAADLAPGAIHGDDEVGILGEQGSRHDVLVWAPACGIRRAVVRSPARCKASAKSKGRRHAFALPRPLEIT